MINYLKDQVNEVVVTLTERVTIANPFFLLVLTNKSTDVITKTFLTDLSTETQRFNKFIVNLTLPTNDYVYEFFQKSSTANQNTEGARLLETGLWRVIEEEVPIKYYDPS